MKAMNESYECMECGNRFDFPDKINESYEFWGGIYHETFEVCPFCHSWAFDVVCHDDDYGDDEDDEHEI